MAQIKANYADLLGGLTQEFVRYTSASALFYHDPHDKPGLRIESIELMKEFVSNVEFGKGRLDPLTLLYLLLTVFQIQRAYCSTMKNLTLITSTVQ